MEFFFLLQNGDLGRFREDFREDSVWLSLLEDNNIEDPGFEVPDRRHESPSPSGRIVSKFQDLWGVPDFEETKRPGIVRFQRRLLSRIGPFSYLCSNRVSRRPFPQSIDGLVVLSCDKLTRVSLAVPNNIEFGICGGFRALFELLNMKSSQ